MNLLLDTHTLLWWLTDDAKLPIRCANLIEDRANIIAISPVSAYEIRFKAEKGLLPGGDLLAADMGAMAEKAGFVVLPVTLQHALIAVGLPLPHRDPFDRFLAAQSIAEGYVVLSVDGSFDGLGASRTW